MARDNRFRKKNGLHQKIFLAFLCLYVNYWEIRFYASNNRSVTKVFHSGYHFATNRIKNFIICIFPS